MNSYPSLFERFFVAIPVVRAYNSVWAELKLTDSSVHDQAERVALLYCVTPPLVLVHVCCCLAQSLSVYPFTNSGIVLISIKHFAFGTPFRYLAMRFTFISSLSVGQVIFLAVSITLYRMSARSWHMYNSFPTTVLHTARFPCSNQRLCYWLFSLHLELPQVLSPPVWSRTAHISDAQTILSRGSSCSVLFVVSKKQPSSRACHVSHLAWSCTFLFYTQHSDLFLCFSFRTGQIPVHRNQDSCLAVLPNSLRLQVMSPWLLSR